MNSEAALVQWDGTTENIVMQLALNATSDNVALVVPTPTPATVKAGDKADAKRSELPSAQELDDVVGQFLAGILL